MIPCLSFPIFLFFSDYKKETPRTIRGVRKNHMFDLIVLCVGQKTHTDSISQNTNIYITTEERYFA